uniref:Tetratricopeptide repeat protein 27 n=1 Tax=Tetraodon nigroviridis TaxID=99883 RepID=H3CIY0_TETNG
GMALGAELSILRGFFTPEEEKAWRQNPASCGAEASSLLEAFLEGRFEAVLLSRQVEDLLAGDGSGAAEDVQAYLEGRVSLYLTRGPCGDQADRELLLLLLAASCLQLFAQSNWTGPPVSGALSDLLPPAVPRPQSRTLAEAVHWHLLLDGEAVYSLVGHPLLLLLARVVLLQASSRRSSLQLVPWWMLRYVSLHQQILEACSHPAAQPGSEQHGERFVRAQLHLACASASLLQEAHAGRAPGSQRRPSIGLISKSPEGALGKRTQFQQKFLAQLVLQVHRKDQSSGAHEDSPTCTPPSMLPKNCRLNDDTLLEDVSLARPSQAVLPDLRAEEQALVLGVCADLQKNNPAHKLTEEELLAFTSCVLSQPKFWALQVSALCLRSRLEKESSRRVERGMMQLQEIVSCCEEQTCPVSERLKLFYCSHVPPQWLVQKQLAALLSDLGCVSSALLAYEKLELWEDAVVCYQRLGQHGKAEQLVRRELERKETPGLYCLLGDVLKEHQYYERAWQLSGRRAGAMRSRALLYLRDKDFQRCADCFQESVRINPIQAVGVWFSLGCAYFALENYEGAAGAFHRCIGLEPDNAEAWNNLSTAYIRLKKKKQAFHTLREALRCNFEHWQIWENYITVCTDVGEFGEAVRAYHQLMELRDHYKDVQILQILVRAVVEDLPDGQGEPAGALRPKLRELLGRVSSCHSSDAQVWQLYARLYGDGRSSDPQDREKALEFLSKAHRCDLRAGGWETQPELFKEVIQRALHIGEVTVACCQTKSSRSQALQMVSTARLNLSSLSAKAKQMHTDVATGQVCAALQDSVEALERLTSELQELQVKLRQQ